MSSSFSRANAATTQKNNDKGKKTLSELLAIRDHKRREVEQLFEEKKAIEERMKLLNDELFNLDDEIDAQELAELRQTEQEYDDASSSLFVLKKEKTAPASSVQFMTMNPEEILTEPLSSTMMSQLEVADQLTDPLTSTERAMMTTMTSDPRRASLYDDCDTGSDEREKNRDEWRSSGGSSRSNSGTRRDVRRWTAALPPLQVQNVDRKSAPNKALSGKRASFSVPTNGQHQPERTTTSAAAATSIISNNKTQDMSSSTAAQKQAAAASRNCPYSELDILQTLKQSFRLQSFRENQLEVIQTTLSGKDCFVLMKTGGGKSLLYQIPAVLESPKITLVVSPLLSLIQDQEIQMNNFVRSSCVSFTSGMGAAQHTANWNRVRDICGGVMMILVTPEKVFKSNKLKSELQRLEEQNRLGRFVIDECHCACQWGHDFRPDYAKLQVLRHNFPRVPILAVTATASDQVRHDCAKIFRLSRDYAFFRSTANRPNLYYQVRPKECASDVIQDMVTFIRKKHPKSAGIVYTYSRKDADVVANQLCREGIVAAAYHSEVSVTNKNAIHQRWMNNETQVVVATIAFGLGINKPDVRFVLHHTLSKTLEAYYQESGRAGRDGKPSDCILYYSAKDVPRMLKMINGDASAKHLFATMVKYAQQFGDDQACRSMILQNLGEAIQKMEQFEGLNEMVEMRDVTSHATTVLHLLHLHQSERMTMPMLIKEWRQSPNQAPECVKSNPPGKELTSSDCERIIVGLLVNDFIIPDIRYTAYDTIVYLKCTPKAASFITSDKARMRLPLPKKIAKTRRKSNPTTPTNENGWIEKEAITTRKRASNAAGAKKKKAKTSISSSKEKKSLPEKENMSTEGNGKKVARDEVIEIDDSDDASGEVQDTARKATLRTSSTAASPPRAAAPKIYDDNLWDNDSENEFEG